MTTMPEDSHTLDTAIRQFAIASARERAAMEDVISATARGPDYDMAHAELMAAKENCDRAARLVRDIDNRASNLTPGYLTAQGLAPGLYMPARALRPTGGELRLVENSRNPDGTVVARGPSWPEEA
jgi:hypothetical protein